MEISSSHKIIRIQGIDAFTFLQGQLSNDLRLSNDSTFQKNALCNIKGRVISLIWFASNIVKHSFKVSVRMKLF